jgi:glutamine amidotransferase
VQKIALIDYGMGNLRSVANAFAAIGNPVEVVRDAEALRTADRIVLPGVGAFTDGMRNLRERGYDVVLEEEVRGKGKPFLGLCVGMQLLATTGTENGPTAGLGWIPGVVDRLPGGNGVRVPHIGWNDVRVTRNDGLYAELGEADTFYFAHSYAFLPDDPTVATGVCEHGVEFAASVERDNVFATQFHPEKSQKAGLALLRRFLSLS